MKPTLPGRNRGHGPGELNARGARLERIEIEGKGLDFTHPCVFYL
jgi:hypothetical protein